MTKRASPLPRKGEECFEFLGIGFNVTYALELIAARKDAAPNGKVAVHAMAHHMCVINREHAMSPAIDLTKPVIIAPLGAPYGNLSIDGHHRSYRAEAEGIQFLPAYFLTPKEVRECCYTRDTLTRLRRNARKFK